MDVANLQRKISYSVFLRQKILPTDSDNQMKADSKTVDIKV